MTEWHITVDEGRLNARVTAETASEALDELARHLDHWTFMSVKRAEGDGDAQGPS